MNNEQNNFGATNNVNPVNNAAPNPTVQPVVVPVTPAPAVQPVIVEKPKSNNGIIVILLIIILALLGACGYFVYDKYFATKPSTPSTNNQTNNQSANNADQTPVVNPENNTTNNGNNSSVDADAYEKMAIGNSAIGENIIIKNVRYERKNVDSLPSDVHTFDVYLDGKLIAKDYEDILYTTDDAAEYKGTYLNKIGVIKDTNTDASYIAFSVGTKLKVTLYIVDANGQIKFQKSGSKDANAEGFMLKATNEKFKSGDYKYINENVDMVLTYSADYTKSEGVVKSVKISSGNAVESVYKTYTSAEASLIGR